MKERGFTILELLVVMAIIASMAALVPPKLQLMYEIHRTRLELNRLVGYLDAAPDMAYLRGHDLALHIDGKRLTLLPEGPTLTLDGNWHLQTSYAMKYWSNGGTEGGLLLADIGTRKYLLRQRAGDGMVTIHEQK